jgi:hypothetical protein
MRTNGGSRAAALAGALTVGAGLVHAAAAGSHSGENTLVVLFALSAVAQVGLGMAAIMRPDRPALVALIAVNVVIALGWVLSRTTGVSFIPDLTQPEAVGLPDGLCMAMQSAAVVVAAVAIVRGQGAARPALSPVCAIVLLPALIGMTAPHTHEEGHVHGQVAAGLAADPIFAGADTSHASEPQLAVAKALIERTRSSAIQRFPNRAALEAAGYHSIGDGIPFTDFQHFLNTSYLTDGRELDPDHIESIVTDATGQRIVSAMYILERGKTMADVPHDAGDLTAWHDHQDLCWDSSGVRLAGVLRNGRCFPGGTLAATPPMLHVWLAQNECGPFAGIEGHGALCSAHHSH